MIKTIHHRDTETQRKAKAQAGVDYQCVAILDREFNVSVSFWVGLSLCLCVSVVQGVAL
jgi:hypothetical protein